MVVESLVLLLLDLYYVVVSRDIVTSGPFYTELISDLFEVRSNSDYSRFWTPILGLSDPAGCINLTSSGFADSTILAFFYSLLL